LLLVGLAIMGLVDWRRATEKAPPTSESEVSTA